MHSRSLASPRDGVRRDGTTMDWDTVAWAKSTYPQSPSAEEQEERQYDRNLDEEFHRLTSTPPETVTMVAERSSTIVGLRFASQDDRKGENGWELLCQGRARATAYRAGGTAQTDSGMQSTPMRRARRPRDLWHDGGRGIRWHGTARRGYRPRKRVRGREDLTT